MCHGMISGKEKEHPLPWFIWTTAYIIFTVSVSIRLQRWEELVYPLSNALPCLVVSIIAIHKRQQMF
jgi:hypothetical protein